MIQAIQFLLSLTLLVVAHEFGHYFFSRRYGVRVEKFYMFFNPGFALFRARKVNGKWKFRFFAKNEKPSDVPLEELPDEDWRKYPQNTEWGIGWLPLGGYCRIAGMVDETQWNESKDHTPKPWEYRAAKTTHRLPIITGGVLVNFVLALMLYVAILFTWGRSYLLFSDVKQGFEFSELAKEYGFRDGDRVIEADGMDLGEFDADAIRRLLKAQTVTLVRDGKTHTLSLPEDFKTSIVNSRDHFLTPALPFVVDSVMPQTAAAQAGMQRNDSITAVNGVKGSSFARLSEEIRRNAGHSVSVEFVRNGTVQTAELKPDTTGKIGVMIYTYEHYYPIRHEDYSLAESVPAGILLGLRQLKGYVSDFRYLFSEGGYRNLGGFKSLGSLYAPEWDWRSFWSITAFLSIILAFMNLLPIPGLDGGHLLFLLYEMVTGRKPSEVFLERAQMIGMLFLLLLVFYANLNDFI